MHHSAFPRQGAGYTAEVHRNLQAAPTYRPELDLVVIAPDGRFVAFCLAWLDKVNHSANLEPLGTHPDFRRRGLARALLGEAMRRVRDLGGEMVYLGAGDGPEKGLCDALGFEASARECFWYKQFSE